MSTNGPGPLFQNSFYVGNTLMAILYGVELMLYFQTIQQLYNRHSKTHKFLMLFTTVLLFCITVLFMSHCLLAQEMWVVNQDWPGGPSAYYAEHSAAWYQTWGSATYLLLELMSDGVLIHRCWTVWCGSWKVIVVPCLFWLATLAAGIVELYVSGSPHANFFIGSVARVGIIYFSLSITLNVLTTSLILGRIIYYGRTVRNKLGDAFASTYFTLASVIVESALPYTLSSIAFIVSFGIGSQFSIVLLSIYTMFTAISPQLLILRAARGNAWTKSTGTGRQSTLAFAGSETLNRLPSRAQNRVTTTQLHSLVPTPSEDWKSGISSDA